MNTQLFDELSQKLVSVIPVGLKQAESELKNKFRDILQGVFARLDLVTREEFDVQTKVLARTRQKIEALEKIISDLENQIKKP